MFLVKSASCYSRRQTPALAVRNTGQQVPAHAVASLFEPFRRLAADRTNHYGGAGLGLSIARSITTAHDGSIRARPRSEGGLIVEIDLPAQTFSGRITRLLSGP